MSVQPGLGGAALAHPARIVILRHAEKRDHLQLCAVGVERADALAREYLGKGAASNAVLGADPPAAFYSVTLHTLETLAPAAASWGMPQITYAPTAAVLGIEKDAEINRTTQSAVQAIMGDPAYAGRTVVMAWEHRHIADRRMEASFPGQAVTLRQLLHLGRIPGVPAQWEKGNYDYFWIVTYADPVSDVPTGFQMVRQRLGGVAGRVPENRWGVSQKLPGECVREDVP